jgi:hypothetical protein
LRGCRSAGPANRCRSCSQGHGLSGLFDATPVTANPLSAKDFPSVDVSVRGGEMGRALEHSGRVDGRGGAGRVRRDLRHGRGLAGGGAAADRARRAVRADRCGWSTSCWARPCCDRPVRQTRGRPPTTTPPIASTRAPPPQLTASKLRTDGGTQCGRALLLPKDMSFDLMLWCRPCPSIQDAEPRTSIVPRV